MIVNIVHTYILILLSVVCVKGCASPIEISLVEEVITTPSGVEVSVVVLICAYVLIWLIRVPLHCPVHHR